MVKGLIQVPRPLISSSYTSPICLTSPHFPLLPDDKQLPSFSQSGEDPSRFQWNIALVRLGCYNKILHTWWPLNNKCLCLEAGKSKFMAPGNSESGIVFLPRWLSSCYVLTWCKWPGGFLRPFSYNSTSPIHDGSFIT